MSEKTPSTNEGLLDNWEVNKAAFEEENRRQQWSESLYGASGKTDFSDDAKKRAEEAESYENHMYALMNRADDYDPMTADLADSVERTMQGDAKTRQMMLLASEIRKIASHKLDENDDVEALERQLKDKEDRLQELLENYMQSGAASQHEKGEIMNRIINLTREEPTSENGEPESGVDVAVTASPKDVQEATANVDKTPVETEKSEPVNLDDEFAAANIRVSELGKQLEEKATRELEEKFPKIDTSWTEEHELGEKQALAHSKDADQAEVAPSTDTTDANETQAASVDTSWVDEMEPGERAALVASMNTGEASEHHSESKWEQFRSAPGKYIAAYLSTRQNRLRGWLDARRSSENERAHERTVLIGAGAVAALGVGYVLYRAGFTPWDFGDGAAQASTLGIEPNSIEPAKIVSSGTSVDVSSIEPNLIDHADQAVAVPAPHDTELAPTLLEHSPFTSSSAGAEVGNHVAQDSLDTGVKLGGLEVEQERPVVDHGEGLNSFVRDNYGHSLTHEQSMKLGAELHDQGSMYRDDEYLGKRFGNPYGISEPGQVDVQTHDTIRDMVDDGELNNSVSQEVDRGETQPSGEETPAEPTPEVPVIEELSATERTLANPRIKELVESGDYANLNRLDMQQLGLDHLGEQLKDLTYTDGTSIYSDAKGFVNKPEGADLPRKAIDILNQHLRQLGLNEYTTDAFNG